jgi:steroid delta-isomerase-like uncharacterized protein
MERTGQCHCGLLRVITAGEPTRVYLCHCQSCQRRTGAAFHYGATFLKERVRLDGQPKVFERLAHTGYRIRFHFCPNCGSTLYWEGDRNAAVCGVAVGAFETGTFLPPSDSIFEESMHEWFELPAEMQHHQHNRHASQRSEPEMLVRRFYDEVWNRMDEAVAHEILASDFRFRGSLGPEKVGVDGFLEYMRSVHRALGDYECVIVDLIVTNGRAGARMSFHGRHQADFFGVPATGLHIEWAGAAFFETSDHKISKLWVLGDIDSVKLQLSSRATSFTC